MQKHSHLGFTLAELLVALLILAEIASFTIPKIISAQRNSRNSAVAKEDMAILSASYQQLGLSNSVSYSTTAGAFTQYMNYTKIDTSTTIDGLPTGANLTCSATYICAKLHNGSIIFFDATTFTNSSGFVDAAIDPDGQFTGNNDSLGVLLFYNGRLTDFGAYFNNSSLTPTWFVY